MKTKPLEKRKIGKVWEYRLGHDEAARLAREHPGETYHTGWMRDEVQTLYCVFGDGVLRSLLTTQNNGRSSDWRDVL